MEIEAGVGVVTDPSDAALSEIIEIRRQQAALHRREIELLVSMRRHASSRLPEGATPGGVRRVTGDNDDRWVRAAEIVASELAPALSISPLTAVNLVHSADRVTRLFPGLLERLGVDVAFDAARLRSIEHLTSEISDAAVYLARAGFTTGVVLDVDGGYAHGR